ncbi:metal-dependent hydrolase family protein [Steroidobacter sp.]|uniref:metal-dependent hydrolase family protein n=1 Tax=Steroidobacter sp. TaxID=1978227 RepID=UPI001A525E9A|nr:amidohydrolase family protein [Steroidobacter sp.]MBL8265093.1 amidohydrolase family protein [Steroidobacter sp.]
MPGLIDAHVHVMISELNIGKLKQMPATLAALRAGPILSGMLDRGFTTVRDTGGADHGLKEALASGVVRGPRLFIAGRAISQTGGHVDYRERTESGPVGCGCCSGLDLLCAVVDGVPGMLAAVREQLRQGADHIKLTVSGGVASPHDPLESLQFTPQEISAAVQAATDWGAYVCAHAYSSAAISRALDCGVRSIEHGNMIDAKTAQQAAEQGAFVVPTLVTYDCLDRFGAELGMSEASRAKNTKVLQAGVASLEICKAAGVRLGFGTDLLGPLHEHQSREFLIRSEVLTPAELLRSATLTNASLLQRDGQLGIVAEGAVADLIVVDGDPLSDLALLQDGGAHIPLVMQAGSIVKNALL